MAYNNSDRFLQITCKNCVWHVSYSFYLTAIQFYFIFFHFSHSILFSSQICQLATFNFTCPNPDVALKIGTNYIIGDNWHTVQKREKENSKKISTQNKTFHLTKCQGLLVCQPTLTLITGHWITFNLAKTIVWFY